MTDATLTPTPSRLALAIFAMKASLLRLRRSVAHRTQDQAAGPHPVTAALVTAPVLAEVRSPLWAPLTGTRDEALTLGKIENLRRALRGLNGIEVPAQRVFSFWKQVGRPTHRRGFVPGRELREGCIISSVGGGLCQLSNALYEAALQAGFRILERHAHSRIVPGSRAELGRDATVFWNYVDLRFAAAIPFRVEAQLSADELIVRLRGAEPGHEPAADIALPRRTANDCTTCGRSDCHLNAPDTAAPARRLPEAWLVDGAAPEFVSHFQTAATNKDMLFLPQRLRSRGVTWTKGITGVERHATMLALKRAYALRNLPPQGGALQSALLRYDAALAAHYADSLPHTIGKLVVAQRLLPFLWRAGALGGRRYDVLMERLPLATLQAELDQAKRRYPGSPTLADFRAAPEMVEAERKALAAADRIITPHSAIAAAFGDRAMLLPWARPDVATRGATGRTLLFPASPLARKGVYALAEALRGLEDVNLAITGRAEEGRDGLWAGVHVQHTPHKWPETIAAVVLPAIVEHQPRPLLRALAMGLPVIASPACGLLPQPGLTLVDPYDSAALRKAIIAALPR